MSQLRVECFSISVDGFGAGPKQSLENPLGVGGTELHEWAFKTRTFQKMIGGNGGSTGIDDDFAARGFDHVGAWILGRNMFAPTRGAWREDGWKGWWGDNPPYHTQVFVLTHYPRPSLVMDGGTTFHFVNESIETVLARAKSAANGMDVRLGGGVATIRQFLQAQLIDQLHLVIAPTLLGSGEHLFNGIDLRSLGYRCVNSVGSDTAMHLVFRKAT